MNAKSAVENLYAFQVQSSLLALYLQLAGSDEKSNRSGNFESTYKNAAGNEVTVKRSSDGKFTSKGGEGTSSSDPESKGRQADTAKTSNTAKLTKDVLSGEKGDQIKDALVATTGDPNVKTGIKKANFSEILGGAGDAVLNAAAYIGAKLKQAKTAASKQPLGVIMGEILVGAFVLSAVATTAAIAAGASGPVAAGIAVASFTETTLIGDAITSEKFKRERAEKFKNFQQPLSYKELDEQFEKLKKDKAAQEKLHKAIKKAVTIEDIERLNKGKKDSE